MRNSATARLVVMGGLALALIVPLTWVYSIVSERASRRDAAVKEVSSTWGGPQIVSGPVLAHEKAALLAAIRTVWGVNGVEDLLVVHDHPESIPSLQGGSDLLAMHPHEHWPPAHR